MKTKLSFLTIVLMGVLSSSVYANSDRGRDKSFPKNTFVSIASETKTEEERQAEYELKKKEEKVTKDAGLALRFLEKDVEDRIEYLRELNRKEKQELMASFQSLTMITSDRSMKDLSDKMVWILKETYPEIKRKWDHIEEWKGVLFYQDDHMVDYEKFDTRPYTTDGKVNQRLNNRVRIQLGLAPISHDGTPIEVCVMSARKDASYLEVLGAEAEAILKALNLDASVENACLRGDVQKEYWKKRHSDFVDGYLNYTQRYKYKNR